MRPRLSLRCSTGALSVRLSLLALVSLPGLAGCDEGVHVREPQAVYAVSPQPLVAVAPQPATIVVAQPHNDIVHVTAGGEGARVLTLADLQALANHAAWDELASHLEDIPPAGRNAEWQRLVEQAALGVLSRAGEKAASFALFTSESLLERYPTLKQSREFMARRADVGEQAFERCFDKSPQAEPCAAHLRAFVRADPSDRDLAFRLGKLLPPRAYGRLAVPAFAVAIQSENDPRCGDPDVKRAVLSGLSLPRAGNEDTVAESIQLGLNRCWQSLAPAITERMGGNSTDYLRNTCPFVRARQGLSALMSKSCQFALSASSQP
jgi:hypothetical protein